MWFLKADSDGRLFYVGNDKKELYVGRSRETCALALPDDSSISRRHAVLRLQQHRLSLQDLESSNKTFLNEKTPLDPNIPVVLSSNDKILFGINNNVWTVYTVDFITCTSTLKGENLIQIKKDLDEIGGKILSDWDEAVTHLTMPAIQMTIKVLQALAYARPIVTSDFWTACRESVKNNQPLPEPQEYLPPVVEASLNVENVSFAPDVSRKQIFAGKKFYFFSRKQMITYKNILLQCSADVALLSECRVTKSKLCADGVVVVQFASAMTGHETQSQQHVMGDIVSYLNNKSRRVVPDLEISLAVLYCSTEKYCNPQLSIPMQILDACNKSIETEPTSAVLAPETQDLGENKTDKPEVVIDQSLVSLRNEDAKEDSLASSMCTREGVERNKRKINSCEDHDENTRKRPALNTSLRETEQSMFDFQEDNSKIAAAADPIKPVEKRLDFMKAKNRRNENANEENIFEFLPDQKDAVQSSSGNSDKRHRLFQNTTNKRKPDDNEMPQAKKAHIETSPTASTSLSDVKTDISELLKNLPWKSCSIEKAKGEPIKRENINELEETIRDLGVTVVTMRNDLIKREVSLLLNSSVAPPYTGSNFKKFKKVVPLRMQMTIMPSSVMGVYRSVAEVDLNKDGDSSEDEPEIWIPNTKKGGKVNAR